MSKTHRHQLQRRVKELQHKKGKTPAEWAELDRLVQQTGGAVLDYDKHHRFVHAEKRAKRDHLRHRVDTANPKRPKDLTE